MKIAWLIQGNEQWGIRSGSRALILALRQLGVECPVISLGDGEFTEECKSLGLTITELDVGPLPLFSGGLGKKLVQFVQLSRREFQAQKLVTDALEKLGADALHFRRPNLVKLGGRAAFVNNMPSFWHIPNAIGSTYPFDLNRRIYQSRCKKLGIVPLANSHFTATTLGLNPVKPYVMYLAVDVDRFNPDNIEPIPRQSLGIDKEATVFGVVARLFPNKGQDRAIGATLDLIRDGHNLHLMIIGGPVRGEYYDRLASLKQQSEYGERIHIIGPVTKVERYYRMLDFSLNCRIDPEPCGISILESMMCETPALVHASGGPAETVIDGITGWHYHDPSEDELRGGILRAIGDKDNWSKIGKAARVHALAEFSQEVQARQYLQIVREILGKSRP
jgi:glycosyltransferase involved in cell wall biosynthesis